ncbi:Helix-turn-helix [Micromonospora pattaloongensis]|uniref:Helix-turn-helix n=1 Tax=Micromonospora pattaloongensis TaxID=405436 RepID=A0A1H3GW98_9ACTN|nr:helix-turn-helix transcriptional regulator [Micromonospora pattaloongensis]SDY07596.1 Helix-turn-helix [Micromonospora pattaloongensis]
MASPKDLPRDVGGFIRDLRRNAKISLRQLAEQAGVSNPYLSQIERGLRKPSAEVLQQLASALRVSTPVMYLRAGLLDDNNGQGVLAAIAADNELTMSQKQSLSQIYETFRRENARLAEAEAAPAPDATTAAGAAPAAERPATPTDGALESVAVTEAGATPTPKRKPGRRAATEASRPRREGTGPNRAAASVAEEEK